MVEEVNPPRRTYDSTLRQDRARQTRRDIVDAATTLFTDQGYGATSLQAIADEANVAVQTIYATFKNKPTILAEALDVAIAGDDRKITVNQREWMSEVWTAPTGEQRLLAYAAAVGQIMTRASDMFTVVSAAAHTDPSVSALDAETQQRRRSGSTMVVNAILETSPLAPGLTQERAIDIVWLLNSPPVHQQLVRASHWSDDDYVTWLGSALVRELLANTTATRPADSRPT